MSGDCRAGGPGSSVEVFVQRVADRRGVAATDYAVSSSGNWSGIITIPSRDLNGAEVTPGDYSMQADCEFENDPDAEFSFADQNFRVTPGDNPDCGSVSCDGLPTEVDCVKDPAACEKLATQIPGGEAARTASGAPLPVPSGQVGPRGSGNGSQTAGAGQPGEVQGSPLAAESAIRLIELRPSPSVSSAPRIDSERRAAIPGTSRVSSIQMWAGILLITAASGAFLYVISMRRHAKKPDSR